VNVPGKPFQLSPMFASKAGANSSKAPFWCSTLELAPGLTHKYKMFLERTARDKHCSLLWKSWITVVKCFLTLGPGSNSKMMSNWDCWQFSSLDERHSESNFVSNSPSSPIVERIFSVSSSRGGTDGPPPVALWAAFNLEAFCLTRYFLFFQFVLRNFPSRGMSMNPLLMQYFL